MLKPELARGWPLLVAIAEAESEHHRDKCKCGSCVMAGRRGMRYGAKSDTKKAKTPQPNAERMGFIVGRAENVGDAIRRTGRPKTKRVSSKEPDRPRAQASGMPFERRPFDEDVLRERALGAL